MNEYRTPVIVGVVNITNDSFSDGGRYISKSAALQHAIDLWAGGADIIELGAESSNPDASEVPEEIEIGRLRPVITELVSRGVPVSIDSRKPNVQAAMTALGASMINDITGFPDPVPRYLSRSSCRVVIMHSVQRNRRADRRITDPDGLLDSISEFFQSRIAALTRIGVRRDRIVIDPGMGFFLGANPEASVAVLSRIAILQRRFELPIMISVSRKSFLRHLADCDVADSGPATLAAELFAASAGVFYVRTHDSIALRRGLRVLSALMTDHSVTPGTPTA